MTTDFWKTITETIIGGFVVLFGEYLIIQPLYKKYQKEDIKSNKVFRFIITKFATISPSSILKIVISFILGILFTILISQQTNTNLAGTGFFGFPKSSCGITKTGIVGQVIGVAWVSKGEAIVSTDPPTSSVQIDENGYFSICDITLINGEKQYTVTASTGWNYGSNKVTVSPNRTVHTIIYIYSNH